MTIEVYLLIALGLAMIYSAHPIWALYRHDKIYPITHFRELCVFTTMMLHIPTIIVASLCRHGIKGFFKFFTEKQ